MVRRDRIVPCPPPLPSGHGSAEADCVILLFDKAFGGLPVLRTQAGDVNAERGAVD